MAGKRNISLWETAAAIAQPIADRIQADSRQPSPTGVGDTGNNAETVTPNPVSAPKVNPTKTLNGGDGSNLGYTPNPIDKVGTGTKAESEPNLVKQMDGVTAKGAEIMNNKIVAESKKEQEQMDFNKKGMGLAIPSNEDMAASIPINSASLAEEYERRNKEAQDEYDRKQYRAKLFQGLYQGLNALTQVPGAVGKGNSALAVNDEPWKELQGDLADRLKRAREDNKSWYERQHKEAMDSFTNRLKQQESDAKVAAYNGLTNQRNSQSNLYDARTLQVLGKAELERELADANIALKKAQTYLAEVRGTMLEEKARQDAEKLQAYVSNVENQIKNRDKATEIQQQNANTNERKVNDRINNPQNDSGGRTEGSGFGGSGVTPGGRKTIPGYGTKSNGKKSIKGYGTNNS